MKKKGTANRQKRSIHFPVSGWGVVLPPTVCSRTTAINATNRNASMPTIRRSECSLPSILITPRRKQRHRVKDLSHADGQLDHSQKRLTTRNAMPGRYPSRLTLPPVLSSSEFAPAGGFARLGVELGVPEQHLDDADTDVLL
jgi:hypothetical protein